MRTVRWCVSRRRFAAISRVPSCLCEAAATQAVAPRHPARGMDACREAVRAPKSAISRPGTNGIWDFSSEPCSSAGPGLLPAMFAMYGAAAPCAPDWSSWTAPSASQSCSRSPPTSCRHSPPCGPRECERVWDAGVNGHRVRVARAAWARCVRKKGMASGCEHEGGHRCGRV